jgi:hypothetical protein
MNDQFLTDAVEAGSTFTRHIDLHGALAAVNESGKIKISNSGNFCIPIVPHKDRIVAVISNELEIALGKGLNYGLFHFLGEYH